MQRSDEAAPPVQAEVDAVWDLLLALRREADRSASPALRGFTRKAAGWRPFDPDRADLVVDLAAATLRRTPGSMAPAALELLELHLAHALSRAHVVALLGQSLDGFIATREGHSRYINGEASLVHLHRLRALSDAVVIGVGTAVADAPRLTTRHVPGPHAVRVVIDPRGRLPASSGLLHDGAGPTLVVRGGEDAPGETRLTTQATALSLPAPAAAIDPAEVLGLLAARGLTRILVEGGGCTVGRFVDAGLLDRLQLAISPLILGGGRPALPIAPAARLDLALRPPCRHFRMGDDMLFDLALRTQAPAATHSAGRG